MGIPLVELLICVLLMVVAFADQVRAGPGSHGCFCGDEQAVEGQEMR